MCSDDDTSADVLHDTDEKSTTPKNSLTLNFILKNIRTVLALLVPLILFPYTSRILGPDGMGKVEFANSIISYFVLFTALGVPMYGLREIARNKHDKYACTKTVIELSIILAVTTAAGYAVYGALMFFIPLFREHLLLFLIVSPSLFLSDFSFEWFFTGIEKQKYITVRYIIVKIIQILCVFLFIKNSDDVLVYAFLLVGISSLSTLSNIVHIRKYLVHDKSAIKNIFHTLDIYRHIKPVITICAANIAASVYMKLDVVMVGAIAGTEAVGYYHASNKMVRLVISFLVSLSAVIVPRQEHALHNGRIEEYKTLVNTSFRFFLMMSIPACVGLFLTAESALLLFAGEQYAPSITGVKMLSFLIIIVGLADFVGMQILFPHRKEKYFTIAVTAGAAVNIVCNIILIPLYAQNGAVIGTLAAETVGLACQLFFAWKELRRYIRLSIRDTIYPAAAAVMAVFLYICTYFFLSAASLLLCAAVSAIIYFFILYLAKEPVLMLLYAKLLRKCKTVRRVHT